MTFVKSIMLCYFSKGQHNIFLCIITCHTNETMFCVENVED